MFQSGKLVPPSLDERATRSLNLTVLQRMDPFVAEILVTAAHVAFYEFDIDVNQWSRKDVEGTLFVVKRNAQPRFQFIVMNRRNTDNLVEDLLGDFEYEVQVPYILYRNAAHEVNGVWFYKSQDCEAVASLFTRILNAYSKVLPKPKISSNKSEFQELEAAANQEMIENPLEPPVSSSAASVINPPDESFLSFSNAAMNVGSMLNSACAGQPHLTSSSIPLPPHASIASSAMPTAASAMAFSTSSIQIPALDTASNNNHATNLLKPMYFSASVSSAFAKPPISSSIHTAPPLLRPATMQQQYHTPSSQSFPPLATSATLNPNPDYVPAITREGVRNAMMKLVQNDDFIDMVYGEVVNAQISQHEDFSCQKLLTSEMG